jgi:hypothetical protein
VAHLCRPTGQLLTENRMFDRLETVLAAPPGR